MSTTWATYLASKVATDLKRLQRFYGRPTDKEIDDFVAELIAFLVAGYLDSVEYGFRTALGQRVVSLLYQVDRSGNLTTDDRAGGVYARADISNATWFSYLTHHSSWESLTPLDRERFEARLPIHRTPAAAPTDGNGYWEIDRSYSSDGSGVRRQTFRPN